MRGKLVFATVGIIGVVAGLYAMGMIKLNGGNGGADKKSELPLSKQAAAPTITVSKVKAAQFNETVVVTGTLVPRQEVLVAPEVEGLRVMELSADEGDRVRKGQLLARLVSESLDAQLAQNDANLARSSAAIAQSRSSILQSEARVIEARNAFERAKPLKQSGYLSGSVYDQREAAATTAEAQLVSARDGLKLAEAERGQVEAARRELVWKRGNTEVKAPTDGIVSRRNARIGGIAAGAADPMFRIVAQGEIELEAEIPEMQIAKIKEGQTVRVAVAGAEEVIGNVRLISPEIDRTTRLGKVRIFLGDNVALRVGAFGRGTIETATSRGLAVPVPSVVYSPDTTTVQVVANDKVETRRIKTGLAADGLVEVREGLAEGDLVVTRAGTFLRNGDVVRPVLPDTNIVTEVK